MISIFTEALTTTGLGHLGRCTALAEKLLEEDNKTVQIILHTDSIFPDWEYPCPILKLNWNDLDQLENLIREQNNFTETEFQTFYVDSYLAELNVYSKLKENCKELICIDDNNRLEYPTGSTILNPGYPGLFIKYDQSKYTIITGKDKVLLRKPFREKLPIYSRNNPPKTLLITLGGSDPNRYSEAFLKILIDHFPNLKKCLIIGGGFTNEENLRYLADTNTVFYKNLSALEMRDLMLTIDFAITAGGQTTYELDVCRVPIVVIKTAENQTGNIRGFAELQGVREIFEPKEILSILK